MTINSGESIINEGIAINPRLGLIPECDPDSILPYR